MVESGQPVPGVEVHVHVHKPQYYLVARLSPEDEWGAYKMGGRLRQMT